MECRTCLEVLNVDYSCSLQNKLSIGITIQELLMLFIPGMIKSKTVKDFICGDCMRAIQQFLNFIEKCIAVEQLLRSEELAVVEPFGQKRCYADIDKLVGDSHNNTKSLTKISKVGNTKGTEKPVVENITDFSDTILTDLQNNQRHHNSGTVSELNYITTEEDETDLLQILQPPKNSEQLSTKIITNLNNQDPGETLPEIQEIEQKDLETNLTQLPYGMKTPLIILDELSSDATLTADEISNQSGVTLDDIEEVPPPAILSTDNKEASTKNSYITTIAPSMVSPDTVKEHDRVISITTTNQAIADLLKSLFRSKNYLPCSPSKNKRILFLGNTLPYPRCPLCQVRLFSKRSVKVHFWQVHPNETYPEDDTDLLHIKLNKPLKLKPLHNCPVCIEAFRTKQLLNNHINHYHKDYCRFTCDKCGHRFKKEITYKLHMKNWERYQNCAVKTCHVCKEGLSTDIRLIRRHYETHKNFQCILCKRRFLSERFYEKHIALHQSSKKKTASKKELLCPVCGKLFLNGSSFNSHMSLHSQDRNHMCDKCPKIFKTAIYLKHHMKRVHVEGEKYQCPTCGKMTKTYQSLQSHKKLKHTNTYKHACQICGATFKRGDYYRRHLRKHGNPDRFNLPKNKKYRMGANKRSDVPVSCKYCGSQFNYIVLLRDHLFNCHLLGSTKYKCSYCSMTFANPANKQRHEKRHADPKKLELTCLVCHCRFKTKKEMEVHSAKHKGSVKYKCDECGETFPSKYLMMNHKRYRHFGAEVIKKQKDELLADALSEYIVG